MKKHKTEEEKVYKIIVLILNNKIRMINYIFTKDRMKLKNNPKNLLANLHFLSSGEYVLIKLAIDLWARTSYSTFFDIVHTLDSKNRKRVLKAIYKISNVNNYKYGDWNIDQRGLPF